METKPAARGHQFVTIGAGMTRREMLALTALGLASGAPGMTWAAAPQGELSWGIHTTLAPTWFDPAETPGIITPFMVLYALHDALVKPSRKTPSHRPLPSRGPLPRTP